MRVLLVSPVPPPNGGIATWTQKYIDYFNESTIKIDLVNTSIIGYREKNIGEKNFKDEYKRLKYILKKTIALLKRNKYDVMHINTSCSKTGLIRDYIIVKLANRYDVPTILQCHCNIEDQIKRNHISLLILKKMCLQANKVLVLNQNSCDYLNSLNIISYKFPNFIDDEIIKQDKKKINNVVKNVIFVGHVMRSKGIDELLEVSKLFPNITFNIVGEIKQDYLEINHSKNIRFVGNVNHDKVIDYLDDSDIFILPSYTEGFSLAILEAMARGLPIIATRVGNNAELIAEDNGIIVDVRSVEQLAWAINNLLDVNIRKKMSINNLQKINKFTKSFVLNSLLNIYKEESAKKYV